VIARIEGQEDWRDSLKLPRPTRWLTAAERGLIAFLADCGTAGDIIPDETA
jgi:DNA topoisomerase-1